MSARLSESMSAVTTGRISAKLGTVDFYEKSVQKIRNYNTYIYIL